MTASKKGFGSDLDKVDAYENGPDDFAESPELTDADFERGAVEVNGVPVRRGRPAPNGAKKQVTMRLDPDLLVAMRKTGAGWQARVNEVLRQAFLTRMKSERSRPTQDDAGRMRADERDDRQARFDAILVKGRR